MSGVKCPVSGVTCQVSGVRYHVSPVTCQIRQQTKTPTWNKSKYSNTIGKNGKNRLKSNVAMAQGCLEIGYGLFRAFVPFLLGKSLGDT